MAAKFQVSGRASVGGICSTPSALSNSAVGACSANPRNVDRGARDPVARLADVNAARIARTAEPWVVVASCLTGDPIGVHLRATFRPTSAHEWH